MWKMNKSGISPEKNVKIVCVLSLSAIVCIMVLCFLNTDISLRLYKNKVKKYIERQGFSKETAEILYVAVDHIRYPENINDYKIISLTYADNLKGTHWLITSDGIEKEMMVDEDDWFVTLGDPALHRYYNAIIDSESLEYLGSLPIA